jgi:flagellum-specific peptidoglycan hydrolase FlgJ
MNKFPTLKDFLTAIQPYAQAVEAKYRIPWLLTATQAAHESRNGNSRLTVEANNLFGVTGEGWQTVGKPVYVIETKEYSVSHEPYFTQRPFRKYASWAGSLEDWAGLIMRRYKPAYECAIKNDADGFFKGLQDGGYATDPKYAEQLKARYCELEAVV